MDWSATLASNIRRRSPTLDNGTKPEVDDVKAFHTLLCDIIKGILIGLLGLLLYFLSLRRQRVMKS